MQRYRSLMGQLEEMQIQQNSRKIGIEENIIFAKAMASFQNNDFSMHKKQECLSIAFAIVSKMQGDTQIADYLYELISTRRCMETSFTENI